MPKGRYEKSESDEFNIKSRNKVHKKEQGKRSCIPIPFAIIGYYSYNLKSEIVTDLLKRHIKK